MEPGLGAAAGGHLPSVCAAGRGVEVYSPNLVFHEISLTFLAVGVLRHEQWLPRGRHAPAGRELRGVQH